MCFFASLNCQQQQQFDLLQIRTIIFFLIQPQIKIQHFVILGTTLVVHYPIIITLNYLQYPMIMSFYKHEQPNSCTLVIRRFSFVFFFLPCPDSKSFCECQLCDIFIYLILWFKQNNKQFIYLYIHIHIFVDCRWFQQ